MARAFPDNPALANNAAYMAALQGRDMRQAEMWVSRALEAHPEVAQFRSTGAFVFAELGNISRAESLLEGLDSGYGALARAALAVHLKTASSASEVISETQQSTLNSLEKSWLAKN